MILKPKSCSFPLQRYGCCKNHFCIHVNGDVNFDKLVHESMFYSVITGFPKSGHIFNGFPKSGHKFCALVAHFQLDLTVNSEISVGQETGTFY